MKRTTKLRSAAPLFVGFGALLWLAPSTTVADPCGMVPPIVENGPSNPIQRVGIQNTYMFFDRGIETIVLRPGFTGNVDNFGMLIPFPSPPEIRKVPDQTFEHIEKAIDPPEIEVYPNGRPRRRAPPMAMAGAKPRPSKRKASLSFDTVKVLKQEAVGMYQVAVLEAGSAQALQRWMTEHGYRYPAGMDHAANDYVELGWCFVAVKTRVADKRGVQPRAGMRKARPALPDSFTFQGHVQAMGFRFKTRSPVIPMRLSTFNDGELRNVVYLLTSRPERFEDLSKSTVRRQIPGRRLHRNVSKPLPLRIMHGTVRDLRRPGYWRQGLAQRRDPAPHNGIAKELFASDLLAVRRGRLSHPHEEREKVYLNIGEQLGLRGPANDARITAALKSEREEILGRALRGLNRMTMTVVDGDFPREILATRNLTLTRWRMPVAQNRATEYHVPSHRPRDFTGVRYDGRIPSPRRR